MKPIYTIVFLLLTTFAFSQNNWTLIYENDAEGNAVKGELSALISAVRNGETIRIYFKMGKKRHPETFVEHTALVKFSTIMNSPEGQFVTAQIDPIIGQKPKHKRQEVVLEENLEWSLIASTNGKNDTMMRDVMTGKVSKHRISEWGTKWFVKKSGH